MTKEEISDRWAEYIEELFWDERGDKPVIQKNIEGPPIMKSEIENAIKKLRKGKAVGPDEVAVEMIEATDDVGIELITHLANRIYDTGDIPLDLSRSVFIALPKKPGAIECELHRTISLMSHVIKLILIVLVNRVRRKTQPEIADVQFGFVKGKGTRNAIFALRILAERCIEVQQDLFLCFIDYTKAFDKVRHEDLITLFDSLDIDGKDLRLIRNLYWEQTAAMKIDDSIGEWKQIRRGVRQGCVASPEFFNTSSEMIMRHLEGLPGVCVNGKMINNLRYADDTVLIATNEKDLQELLNIVVEKSERRGLSLNIKKTYSMVVTKETAAPRCSLQIRGENITQVEKFNYLGSWITTDGKSDTEIKARIAQAKQAFSKMENILKTSKISMRTRLRILKAYVWSVLLYGAETWTLNKRLEGHLEAAEMWFLRRILKIPWTERISNQEVLRIAGTTPELLKLIKSRQMSFVGHIIREGKVEHLILTGKIPGKRSRGRPRMMFLDNFTRWLGGGGDTGKMMILKSARNRVKWRAMIANVYVTQDT